MQTPKCLIATLVLLCSCASATQPTDSGPATRPNGPADQHSPTADLAKNQLLHAGILVVDGVYNTEFMAPYDVLQHTVYHSAPNPGIRVFTISPDGQPIKTAEGLLIEPDYSFESSPEIDILVVPSAAGSRDKDLDDPQLVEWVKRVGREAHFVVSLCWGAFVLAEAEILNDHSCTTFPGDYERFATRYPHLDVQINASFVHDGRVITSQGGIRSYEAAMYLVDLIYGEEVARNVGSGLLIDWPLRGEPGDIFITDSASGME